MCLGFVSVRASNRVRTRRAASVSKARSLLKQLPRRNVDGIDAQRVSRNNWGEHWTGGPRRCGRDPELGGTRRTRRISTNHVELQRDRRLPQAISSGVQQLVNVHGLGSDPVTIGFAGFPAIVRSRTARLRRPGAVRPREFCPGLPVASDALLQRSVADVGSAVSDLGSVFSTALPLAHQRRSRASYLAASRMSRGRGSLQHHSGSDNSVEMGGGHVPRLTSAPTTTRLA